MVVVVTIVVLAAASTAIILINIPDQGGTPNTSGVSSIFIIGNSTDILYPELMEATFELQGSEDWVVTANFLDNSESWENPEISDRTFSVTDEEVASISDALSVSLNLTHQSEDDRESISQSNAHIGFHIVISYSDGSWVSIWTLQTELGHILYKHGVGTPDLNMLDADLLTPISALDGLVEAVYIVFSENLDS
jgi:hypothetical protein